MSRTATIVLILLTLTVGVFAAPKTPPKSYPGMIVFSSDRSGSYQLYLMNADRTMIQRVTEGQWNNTMPTVNPKNVRQIVFVSDRSGNKDLFSVDYMDKKVVQLTETSWDEEHPCFSPDGKKVIYRANPEGSYHIYEMDLESKQVKQLSNNAGDDTNPVYSADMKNITYSSNESGKWGIYVAEADGSGARMFTATEKDASYARYSPRDVEYVFQQMMGKDRKDFELFKMNVTGSDLERLTNNGFMDIHPCWSPDSEYIAFVSNREDGMLNIFFMDKDGTQVWNFTQSNKEDKLGNNDYPCWVGTK